MSRPFIPAPHCASVEMIWQVNGEVCENQFHVRGGADLTLSDLEDIRGIANAWDDDHMAALRANGSQLVRIRTRALHVADGAVEDYGLPTPRPGEQGALPFPNNVTLCCKLTSGFAGRSRRGRWYICAIPNNFYGATTNVMNNTIVPLYTAALNALIADMLDGGYEVVIVSYRENNDWRTEALVTPAVSFVAVDANFDSQRRRLAGRGT